MSEPAGDNVAMDMDEIQNPMYKSAREESNAEAIARIEATMATMMSFMQSMATSQNPLGNSWQQESFAAGGLARSQGNNPLKSPTEADKERERRRTSILLQQMEQGTTTVSSLTTIAVPKLFESKSIHNAVNFLTLRDFQQEYAVYKSDPGSHNQLILLWNNQYMSELTRDRTYRKLEAFDNAYQTDRLYQARYPHWTLPTESSLSTLGLTEILSYLEIAIIPDNPRAYETALQDICKSVIDIGKTSVSPSACSYYLGRVKRVVDLIRKYTELVPEAVKVGTKEEKMRYNMGIKKDVTHGTKGTMVIISESIMTPELRFAYADFENPPAQIPTLAKYLEYLESSSDKLQKVYDKLRGWLVACQNHEQKRKDPEKEKTSIKHRSSKIEFAKTAAETDGNSDQTDAADDDDTTTIDVHDSAAMDAVERSKTPCYAFIEGKCEAGKECARSHRKEVLQAFLKERTLMVERL